jgi:hypothetical protein
VRGGIEGKGETARYDFARPGDTVRLRNAELRDLSRRSLIERSPPTCIPKDQYIRLKITPFLVSTAEYIDVDLSAESS